MVCLLQANYFMQKNKEKNKVFCLDAKKLQLWLQIYTQKENKIKKKQKNKFEYFFFKKKL